jgi:hypothetical protein
MFGMCADLVSPSAQYVRVVLGCRTAYSPSQQLPACNLIPAESVHCGPFMITGFGLQVTLTDESLMRVHFLQERISTT